MHPILCSLLLIPLGGMISKYCESSNAEDRELTPVLSLKNGKVQGYYQDIDNGKKLAVYEGIRYGMFVK